MTMNDFAEPHVHIEARVTVTEDRTGETKVWSRTVMCPRTEQARQTAFLREGIVRDLDKRNLIFGCTLGPLKIRSWAAHRTEQLRIYGDDAFKPVN